ncbi:MAG TPA: GNAT family N-acetyltransferase [Solirubrobacteraceae bacterium]|nr:GNAT family N-acetyltransferase [Solirubrobacteraceae bacterium]
MSDARPPLAHLSAPGPARFCVRLAGHEDVPAIAVAASSLLLELGGAPAPQPELQRVGHELLEDACAGALIVADAGGAVVGFLGASWQSAVRIPGRYGLIQELWVHPDWRGRAVGGELLSLLCALARESGVERIEVGLPGGRFERLDATESFYEANGFTAIGQRMRRLL